MFSLAKKPSIARTFIQTVVACFFSLVLVSVVYQSLNLADLSSDIDDIGPSQTFSSYSSFARDRTEALKGLNETELRALFVERIGSKYENAVAFMSDIGLLRPLLNLFNAYRSYTIISSSWTYAPFQYLLYPLVLTGTEGYESAKFKTRLITKTFWILGVILLTFTIYKLDTSKFKAITLLAMCLLVFSQQQISFSAHASNYGLGLLAASICLVVFTHYFNSRKQHASFGLCLFIACSMQYQLIPCIFLFYIVAIHREITRGDNLGSLLKHFGLFLGPFLTLLPSLLVKQVGTLNWNVGKNKEFSLLDEYSQFFDSPLYTATAILEEFLKAAFLTIQSVFSPFDFGSYGALTISVLVVCLLISSLFPSQGRFRSLLISCHLILIGHVALYFLGKFPLSPTRHSLYLAVPLLIISCVQITGFKSTLDKMLHKSFQASSVLKITDWGILIGSCICCVIFSSASLNYLELRRDPFSIFTKTNNSELLPKNAVIINTDWTYQIYSIKEITQNHRMVDLNLQRNQPNLRKQFAAIFDEYQENDDDEDIVINVIRISLWSEVDRDFENRLNDYLSSYFGGRLLGVEAIDLLSQESLISTEWMPGIQGFKNDLYITNFKVSISAKN